MAVDYDPGASEVNQLNRIKLMISVAKANLADKEREARVLRARANHTEDPALGAQAKAAAGCGCGCAAIEEDFHTEDEVRTERA